MKLKIETWPIGKVLPYAKNARLHSESQVEALAKSITEFGFVNPCLIDADGVLIAGHGRVLAAKKLGLSDVPVIRLGHLTETQARALRLADNALPLQATWDTKLIQAELTELKLIGYDLPLIGFPDTQLRAWDIAIGTDGKISPEAIPEPPKVPFVQEADLWLLGDHRLLCGDSTKPEDVARVMDGNTALLMATDPPYGVAYDNSERPNPGVAKPRVANDELVEGPAMQAFLEAMLNAALPHMNKHAAFYFWHPMLTQGTYVAAAAAAAAGILIHRQIIWVKPVLLLGRGDYHWRHELCFYGWQQGHRPPFYGPRNQDTIWEVASVTHKERKEMNHATPKPVALWDKPIMNHTKAGEVIYEPFSGSGTQIIAAEMAGRRCFAMELDLANTQVAVERWEAFTGRDAVLESTGKTFVETKISRAKKRRPATTASISEPAHGGLNAPPSALGRIPC